MNILIELTREQFLKLDPAFRTSIDAPVLMTRHLPDGTILRDAIFVRLISNVCA